LSADLPDIGVQLQPEDALRPIRSVSEELAFVVAQRNKDEISVLAEAVREGVRALYRDALVESYMLGKSRESACYRISVRTSLTTSIIGETPLKRT
jgi:hypothetical protein